MLEINIFLLKLFFLHFNSSSAWLLMLSFWNYRELSNFSAPIYLELIVDWEEKKNMAKHHPDLIFCRKQPGVGMLIIFQYLFGFNFSFWKAIGRLCEKCDGKCVICDSYVRPSTLVRICDECNYGSYQGRCVICGGPGISDAYYCRECTILEKDVKRFHFWSFL